MTSTKLNPLNPPSTLNGFYVIAGKPVSPGEFIVIADRGYGHVYDRYIVWRAYLGGQGANRTWLACHGFYTNDLHAALLNMEGR